MSRDYERLPSSLPSTPPNRAFSRSSHRSFNRASPPESLTLSPSSVRSWTEADPCLSPRTHPASPGSPYALFHPPPSPHEALLLSPAQRAELEKTPRGYFELKLPPNTKRSRKTRRWVALGAGVALVLLAVAAMSVLGGVGSIRLEGYKSTVTMKVSGIKDKMSEKWNARVGGMNEETVDEPIPQPPLEKFEPTLAEGSVVREELVGPIPISLLPRSRASTPRSSETRYLGFLPHSGVHNQRIALQNALLLGKLLGRTVLVPPIWIGWPISTLPYDDLAKAWTDVMLSNPGSFNLSDVDETAPLNRAADYPSTLASFPCPTCDADDPVRVAERLRHDAETREKWLAMGYKLRPDGYPITELTAAECKSYKPECRHTYRDTFMSYGFLVDLDKVRDEGVDIVERWDMREKAIEGLLGVEEQDIFVLKDRQAHDFVFTDRGKTLESPLISSSNHSKWNREVSIPTLAARQDKVILVGSLFGSGRIRSKDPQAAAWSHAFARAMAFDNEWLLRPADAVVARLGGSKNFVGVHARIGDGEFLRHAKDNMREAWKTLVGDLGYDDREVAEMCDVIESKQVEGESLGSERSARHSEVAAKLRAKRSAATPPSTFATWAPLDESFDHSDSISSPPSSRSVRRPFEKRSPSPAIEDDDEVWSFLHGPSGEPSALLRNLNCRSKLHTDPNLKPLNIPLYLATDSRSPTTDPNLAPFFDTFPCTFVLSDFDEPDPERNDGVVVESVKDMLRLENELDRVPLGRLFLPFLEAIVAAKGRITVGTAGSTFSGFATGPLHDAYRDA